MFLDIGHDDGDNSASLPNLHSSYGQDSTLATNAKEPPSAVCVSKVSDSNIYKLK